MVVERTLSPFSVTEKQTSTKNSNKRDPYRTMKRMVDIFAENYTILACLQQYLSHTMHWEPGCHFCY